MYIYSFNTTGVGGFTFADQFLQLSAVLPTKYIYGLGEQRNNFLLDVNWTQITLFNHDNPPLDGVSIASAMFSNSRLNTKTNIVSHVMFDLKH